MGLDFDFAILNFEETGKLKIKIDHFNRTKYTFTDFVMNKDVKTTLCNSYIESADQEYISQYGYNYAYKRFLIFFDIARLAFLDKDFFEFNYQKRTIRYSDKIFEENNENGLKYYLYNQLNKYHQSLSIIDVEGDCELLLNIILKISLKHFINKDCLSNKHAITHDLRKLKKDNKWVVRCRMLEYIKESSEITVIAIAHKFHIHYNTARNFYQKYIENPLMTYDDLKEDNRGPEEDPFRIISQQILNELCFCLVEKVPGDFSLDYSSWSGQCIREFLKVRFDINVSMQYLYYFLARNNIVSKFSQRINPKQSKRKKEEFIKKVYPELVSLASKYNSKIVFCDETHVMQGHDQKGYAPIGMRTHVSHNQSCKHTKYSLFTIMSPDGFIRIFKIEGTFTSEKFINCLTELHQENPDTNFLLILDNCHVHNSSEVNSWLNKLHEEGDPFVRMHFLPPYSPEMNPVEYLNQDFKSYLKKLKLNSPSEVITATDTYINQYACNTYECKKRVQSFFLGEGCDYSLISVLDHIFAQENAA